MEFAGTTKLIPEYEIFLKCSEFNHLNAKIRDGLISNKEALRQIQIILPQIKKYFFQQDSIHKSKLIFPVQGYYLNAIGGRNGNGYNSSGYNFFDGNKHLGHPAQDIFIIDKNQDCIDDLTKKKVNVLSMSEGIVVATEPIWDTKSKLRGGKYILIYNPNSNSLLYYAHNDTIFVQPCDIVHSGDIIGIVGRTGLNAFKKRSPTHLHLMQLKLDDNFYPKPEDCYKDLTKSKTK